MKKQCILFFVVFLFFFLEANDFENVRKEAKQSLSELEMKTTTEKWKKTVSENASKITTIKSSFKQIKTLSFLSSEVISGGRFFLKKNEKGNQIKWEYTTPFQYIIIIDGSSIQTKDGEKKVKFDVSSSKVFEEINRIMVDSLNGSIMSDSQNFHFHISEKGRELNIEMTPKHGTTIREYFKSIKMLIDKNDFTVSVITMIESQGDTTQLFFTDKQVNGLVDENEFTLK